MQTAPRAAAATCPVGAVTWLGGDGDWSNGASWSAGVAPTAGVDACIDVAVTVTVDVASSVDALVSNGFLVVPSGSRLTINGASDLADVALAGAVSVVSDTTRAYFSEISDGAVLDASAGATLTLGSGGFDQTELAGGTIVVSGAGVVQVVGGELAASAPTTIASPDGAFALSSCARRCSQALIDGGIHGITLTGDTTWYPDGVADGIVTNDGHITVTGGSPSQDFAGIGGAFTNNGTITWESQVSFGTTSPLTFVNHGQIDVTGTMRFVGYEGPSTFTNIGVINITDGDYFSTRGLDISNSGSLTGGELSAIRIESYDSFPGDLTNTGKISLGQQYVANGFTGASLFVEDSLTHSAGGELRLSVDGSAASQLHSTIEVGGTATLDGALAIERPDDYDPPVGETYTVITYASATGDFSSGTGLAPFFSGTVGAAATTVERIAVDSNTAASGTVVPGGTVATDQSVSPSNPLATSVQTPTGGLVSIVEQTPPPAAPDGYELLGTEYSAIEAPDATVASPLLIQFTLDWSVWDGYTPDGVTLLRNGVPVPNCDTAGATGPAAPDPCVGQRQGTTGGDLTIDVRTSMASDWVVVAEESQDADGDGVLDADDLCPNTAPLGTARPDRLKKNRFAVDASGSFVDKNGSPSGYTIFTTGGCDESQIVAAGGLGQGHLRFGISKSALQAWVANVQG
ncbi:hypothetical protein ACFLQ7_02285 [Actinomycetota bacterium]